MLDANPFAPAVVWMPLTDAEATGSEPVRIGGRPKLPKRIDWPYGADAPLHFYAQIDLSAIPDAVGGRPLPVMPRSGWLFIFLPLGGHDLWEGCRPVLIHVPEDVRSLPERDLPEDLPKITDLPVMPGALIENGTCLRPQYARITGYLSEPTLAPIHQVDLPKVDNPLPLTCVLRQPTLPAPRDWVEAALPDTLRERFPLTEADLDWHRINDITDRILFMAVAVGLERTLCVDKGIDRDVIERDWLPMLDNFQESSWHYLRKNHEQPLHKQWMRMAWMRPKVDGPLDLALIGWMGISAFARGRPSRAAIQAWLDLVAHMANPDGADHVIKTADFPDVPAVHVSKALLKLWEGLDPNRHAPKSWDEAVIAGTTAPRASVAGFRLAGAGRIPLQMFGVGYCLQTEAWTRGDAGDVLLLQIGDAFGSHLAPADMGGLWQIWITPEALAAGRFDEAELTAEMT